MHIALFGGSFDPPHGAHVQILQYLLDAQRFDEIWVVPTPQNLLKPAPLSNFSDRLKMCRLAFTPLDPKIKIFEEAAALTGYTIDLARYLSQQYPQTHFTFIGGSDLQTEIVQWKESDQLRQYLHFEFLPRPPSPHSPFAPISSTQIRERIKNHLPIHELVPQSVEDYIFQHKLYS